MKRNIFLIVFVLLSSACSKANKTIRSEMNAGITVVNKREEIHIWKNGKLVMKGSLIGNAGQICILDNGTEITNIHWFYGEGGVDRLTKIEAPEKKVQE